MYKITTYYYEDEEKIEELFAHSQHHWGEHLCYTRNAIISLLNGTRDIEAVSARLMRNQEDIAELLYPYYDEAQVEAFADVLKEHITLAVALVNAIKAGEDLTAPTKAWHDNGDTMLAWMENVNPYYWSRVVTRPLWNDHLKYTIEEVTNRLKEEWVSDIESFDYNRHCMHKWADLYATGIVYNNMDLFSKKKPRTTPAPKPMRRRKNEPHGEPLRDLREPHPYNPIIVDPSPNPPPKPGPLAPLR